MKRSEMIKELQKPFIVEGAVDLHLFASEADAILERLEQLGMIPPSCEFKMGDMVIRDNCWESE